MTTDIAAYPAPETIIDYPYSIDRLEPIDHGAIVVKMRLVISDAIRNGVFTEQEGVDAMRFLEGY